MTYDHAALSEFLNHINLDNAACTPLPMDASKRRYFRLENAQKLIMTCPPSEKPQQFFKVADLLQSINLRAPKRYAHKGDFYLIEDFGHTTYRNVLNNANRNTLYTLATNVLIHLKDALKLRSDFIPFYDREVLLFEAAIFTQWYLNMEEKCDASSDYLGIWEKLLQQVDVPQCLILRDYHIDNLFYLNQYEDLQACGLIDFQDAVWGPVGYDLVSLTEDARTDVPDDLREFLMDRYISTFPKDLHEAIRHAAAILDMHRQLRILGVFARLQKRDGKTQYAQYKPRLLGYVHRNLKNPVFAHLKKWLEVHRAF